MPWPRWKITVLHQAVGQTWLRFALEQSEVLSMEETESNLPSQLDPSGHYFSSIPFKAKHHQTPSDPCWFILSHRNVRRWSFWERLSVWCIPMQFGSSAVKLVSIDCSDRSPKWLPWRRCLLNFHELCSWDFPALQHFRDTPWAPGMLRSFLHVAKQSSGNRLRAWSDHVRLKFHVEGAQCQYTKKWMIHKFYLVWSMFLMW